MTGAAATLKPRPVQSQRTEGFLEVRTKNWISTCAIALCNQLEKIPSVGNGNPCFWTRLGDGDGEWSVKEQKSRMDIATKAKKLLELYEDFEKKAWVYREAAVCGIGCADCCINVGDVDAITLEGWVILEHMKGMDLGRRSQLEKLIEENALEKEKSIYTRCAFLQDDLSCAIYSVRPFSCRRLYSLVRCGENGPTVHRQVWQMGEETVAAIQVLDGNGCYGHLSHILLLLQEHWFRVTYLAGRNASNKM